MSFSPSASSEGAARRDELLEAYLDGTLIGPDLAGFERLLETDADLRAQVELQGRIDAALRREMALATPIAPAPVAGRIGPAPAASRRMRGLAALAAVIVLGAGAIYFSRGFLASQFFPGTAGSGQREKLTAGQWYDKLLAGGFKPDWVCANDDEFANVTRYKLEQAMLVRPAADITLVGWSYRGWILSPDTCTLLAEIDGKRIVVLVDRAAKEKEIAVDDSKAGGLRVFKEVQAGLVLYEITPLDSPRILPLCYNPDVK